MNDPWLNHCSPYFAMALTTVSVTTEFDLEDWPLLTAHKSPWKVPIQFGNWNDPEASVLKGIAKISLLVNCYDGAKRFIRIDQRKTNTNQGITGFAYEYDRVGNRRFERKLLNNTNATEASGQGSAYTYNSFYQLTEAQHNVLSSQLDSVPSNTAGSTGLTSSNNVFDHHSYDVAGNRLS